MNKLSLVIVLLMLSAACSKPITTSPSPLTRDTEVEIISVEDALSTLAAFLEKMDMQETKSGSIRTISSIVPHYRSGSATRSISDIPDAYLVNFEDGNGFAILGANRSIDPIVAVIDDGNSSWSEILEVDYESHDASASWDEGNSDILGPGIPPDELLSLCVKSALYGCDEEDGDAEADVETETKSGVASINIKPILGSRYEFGQNVTYCHKDNQRFVTNGCASTAVSIIAAYNQYPTLTVDGELLDYANCDTEDDTSGIYYEFKGDGIFVDVNDYFTNSSSIPSSLSQDEKLSLLEKIDSKVIKQHGTPAMSAKLEPFYRTRYKLTSGIYYILNNIVKDWDGTGTMPDAAVNGLKNLGYKDVSKEKKRSLSSGQILTIADHLAAYKPVLMCGWSLWSLSKSHYWVVDGIYRDSDRTLLHCNWGWRGVSNGWFSSDCLRPDSPTTKSTGDNNAWNNLLVFSYNKKDETPAKSVSDFYNNHRVKY